MPAHRSSCPILTRGLLLFTLLCAHSTAQELPATSPEQAGLAAERLARLDHFIMQAVEEDRVPGAVALIARDGRIAHHQAYGLSDPDSGRAMQPDDLFRIYSMTKPVVSVALLMLYEDGHFQLDDPLADHIPAFEGLQVFAGLDQDGEMILDTPPRRPTIHDAFRHTLGMSAGGGSTPVDQLYRDKGILVSQVDSLARQMELLGTVPLLFNPGERWLYGYGHDVQAYLVEHFSGMPLDRFLQERLFNPLGMTDTGYAVPTASDRIAALQGVSDEAPANPAIDMRPATYERFADVPMGTLGLWSTATDFARFSQMLLNGGKLDGQRILSETTVDLMARNHLPPAIGHLENIDDAAGEGYGLGVSVVLDPAARGNLASTGAFGWTGAATTRFIIDPQQQLVAVFMAQTWPYDERLLQEFETLVYQTITEQP